MKRNIIEIDTFLSVYAKNEKIKTEYLQINGLNSMKNYELETLNSLFLQLSPLLTTPVQKMGYLIDKSVRCGIKEQFDILRFSNRTALNIELKYSMPKHGLPGILYQLQRHEHLLKNVCDSVQAFCYILDTNTLYKLYDSKELLEVSFKELASVIDAAYTDDNLLENLNNSSILISPYTEPKKFIESKYFLSDKQRDIIRELMSDNNKLNAIIGGPGTGKSLVLFELAKYYHLEGKKVLFIFSAKFEEENFDNYFPFDFKAIRDVRIDDVVEQYEVILVDEAQRLRRNQVKSLVKSQKVVFAVDHRQVLRFSEDRLGIEEALRKSDDVLIYELEEKVRTDKELSSFIQNFFDTKSNVQIEEFTKINAVYFNLESEVRDFIDKMVLFNNYVAIELTEYTKYNWGRPNEQYRVKISNLSKNQFEVIGREYDKVLVVIDEKVTYDSNGKLILPQRDYDYIEINGLFEALTRVRENLLLVFIRNDNLFIETSRLLNHTTETEKRGNLKKLLTVSQQLEENLIKEGTLEKNEYVATNRKLRNQVGNILKAN
ncbi:TPA: DUF2075 domain-containing protein [Streptococcus suis]|uniref:DNA/RNA helicase domain-containing protein n=1 Tax=Streptococcus suis TaxID=1307 RepID=UPI00209BB98B|nr:DNA/RNA helicase domain-containing protein [Streptococcus suis]MCO8175344.1 DUF2075 domain-containing protein [Streptococcus suis]MCO8209629.1 DUF2075 domain-containing protein [Streptococcus suis]HEM3489975.1 DUF2075 domain-containing protein [Streptococcus suis]HEM3506999.1 DUF2075 domain-containing protein [Streptococcus suis]